MESIPRPGDVPPHGGSSGTQPFLLVSRHLDDEGSLNPNEWLLFLVYSDKAGGWDGFCDETQEELACILNVKGKTIRNLTNELKAKKRIEVDRRDRNHVRVLPFSDDPVQEKEKYSRIPRELYDMGLIRMEFSREIRVYGHLTRVYDLHKVCTESIKTIARRTRVGLSRVRSALTFLEEQDLIERVQPYPKSTWRIRIIPFRQRGRAWEPEEEMLLQLAAKRMLKTWRDYPMVNGEPPREGVQSIVGAMKQSICAHCSDADELGSILIEMEASVVNKVRFDKKRKRPYLNQFIWFGKWKDPHGMKRCMSQGEYQGSSISEGTADYEGDWSSEFEDSGVPF